MCCICNKKKTSATGSGYEALQRCETENAATNLQNAALEKADNAQLVANMTGIDWQVVIAREFHYHKTCFRSYTRQKKIVSSNKQAKPLEDQLNKLQEFIEENVILKGMVINMTEIIKVFDNSSEIGCTPVDPRTLKLKVKDLFGERIDFWSPRSGSCFLYSTEIPVGQIIEIGALKDKTAKKLIEQPSIHKVKEVAAMLRKEILEAPATYRSWPPTEDELTSISTALPIMLETFLKTLLSSKTKLSQKKDSQVLSIGQDIIFCIGNGRKRTSKHVLLSLCTKRKTGSKHIVYWLNRLGHGISYDETCLLETSLAIQQSKEQVLKTFVPNIIQPSQFVTFVWDNNDINPESLTGVSMHCTNGIMIQHSTNHDQIHTDSPLCSLSKPHAKERSFKAIQDVLEPYISKERENPKLINNVILSKETAGEISSRQHDFWWSMLRLYSSRSNIKQTVPNWTGFNHLISEEHQSFHQVKTYVLIGVYCT